MVGTVTPIFHQPGIELVREAGASDSRVPGTNFLGLGDREAPG